MAFKNYFNYFNFVRRNWSLRLALFTIYHEIRGERKYKINTTGYDNLQHLEVRSDNKKAAYIYQPVNYYVAEKAFDYVAGQIERPVLVDFGCGRGRILAIAAYFGFKQITGVEFAHELCKEAEENMKIIKARFQGIQSTVYCGDAVGYEIQKSQNVFTYFNPFNAKVMLPVVKNLLKSLKDNPRDVFVIYFNPTEKEIFLSAGFRELWYYCKLEYVDFSILFKQKNA